MTKTKTENKAKVKKEYSVELELNDKRYKADGTTLLEAIKALEPLVSVDGFKTWGLLIAKKGKLRSERRFLNIVKLKRLFGNKTFQIIIAKNLELMMK